MLDVHYGDILDVQVDAIVNAANTELQHVGGLAAAISRRGGNAIQDESDQIGGCGLGEAVATGAGSLSARYVIHVPTIDYPPPIRATIDDIGRGTRAALRLARELGCRSVALPLLGAGFAGLDSEAVARKMAQVIADFDGLQVTLCVHWQGDRRALDFLQAQAQRS